MHTTCVAKRIQQEHSFLHEPNLPLWPNMRLVATTFNNFEFWDKFKAIMDNEVSMKMKINNDDYTLGVIHNVKLLCFLHFELQVVVYWYIQTNFFMSQGFVSLISPIFYSLFGSTSSSCMYSHFLVSNMINGSS